MGETLVKFWNVQHGNAIYINTPNNRHIVIDLGSNNEFSPLKYLKYTCGVDQLDYVIVTHPHLDHIDDILNFDLLDPKIFHQPKHLLKYKVMQNARQQDIYKLEKYFEIDESIM